MTPADFITRWTQLNKMQLSERTGYQAHFNDLCEMLHHPKPLEQPEFPEFSPDNFTFEKRAAMVGSKGGHGWADVWKNQAFAFEYKKKNRNLDAAYAQLIRYHDDLGNVPVLVTCDFARLHFHIKHTNRKTVEKVILLEHLGTQGNQQFLKDVFHRPDNLDLGEEIEKVTKRVAGQLAAIALSLSTPERYGDDPIRVARFLDRVVFTLFAEDCGLLPRDEFKKIVAIGPLESAKISRRIHNLWRSMASGDDFGQTEIRHFNGALFDEVLLQQEPLMLQPHEVRALQEAANQNWAEIDNSIFGSIFERAIDPKKRFLLGIANQSTIDQIEEAKRSQLGAHYTSRADIETLVNPVIMEPLLEEWQEVKREAEKSLEVGDESKTLQVIESWIEKLGGLRVLDPACGSGNFLFVALQKLLDLEHVARKWSKDYLDFTPRNRVHPRNFYGIEVSVYAHDLARVSLWISYLQWIRQNGYDFHHDPVLESIETIERADALFDKETGAEKDWPKVDFIVGNPPFLGGSKLWGELGRPYQQQLWQIFDGRVRGSADLCCYWFVKAREAIEKGDAKRAGLVATQAIRGGASRQVLEEINLKANDPNGGIFLAVSDRDWVLDGANVHISLIGFDNGSQKNRVLDGEPVEHIYANLTSKLDVTVARTLKENQNICFIGTKKAGDFNLPESEALMWLDVPNPHGKPNSDVLRPWGNGRGLIQSREAQWIIDTGTTLTKEEFELYEQPYFAVDSRVRPSRKSNNRPLYRDKWWLHAETRPGMRKALKKLPRYIATVSHSKHLIFSWISPEVLCDGGVFVFACSEDDFFGVLHSKIHELWALKQGTHLEDRPRYTPTTCFETFPFPDLKPEHKKAIGNAAAHLNQLRENWLNPPEWTKSEIIEFPASADGPWHRHLVPGSVNEKGIGTACWSRLVANNPNRPVADVRFDSSKNINAFRPFHVTTKDALSHRTLTNLYNHPPAWLQSAHRALDEAVFAAYGWPADLSEDEILAYLLDLNLERSQESHTVALEAPATAEEWRDAVGMYLAFHLHNDPHFGRTKFQKLLYLAEATYQLPLEGKYERQAAGPLDVNLIYPLEERAMANEWFHLVPWENGLKRGVNYRLGDEAESAYQASLEFLGGRVQQLDKLIEVFGRCNTETAEKVATLYAAWNDLLLMGKTPTEKEILDEVWGNWHESKKRIPRVVWRHSLDWMKENSFTPQGLGPSTQN